MTDDGEGNRKFSIFDIWFHIGVAINMAVVFLLLWYALG